MKIVFEKKGIHRKHEENKSRVWTNKDIKDVANNGRSAAAFASLFISIDVFIHESLLVFRSSGKRQCRQIERNPRTPGSSRSVRRLILKLEEKREEKQNKEYVLVKIKL